MFEKLEKKEEVKDWEIVAWIKKSESGKALILQMEGKNVGVVSIPSIEKTIRGENKAAPVKVPPEN